MGLRLRHLRIEIQTDRGLFGVHLKFQDGLVVLRAENTSGKSTCLNSIMFALGLEGMLGPSHEPPLPDAMKKSLYLSKEVINVISSEVLLEIQNNEYEVITLRRLVTGNSKIRQVVRVVEGPLLSKPRTDYKVNEYLVRTQGGAQKNAGFHYRLASFIGISLPVVSNFDGEDIPLYLECLFPFFFVEQLAGWRDVKARMPTYLQIPDMAKRSLEFILSLDSMEKALRKKQLERQISSIRSKWKDAIKENRSSVPGLGALIRGIPIEPLADWRKAGSPTLLVYVNDAWRDAATASIDAKTRLSDFVVNLESQVEHGDAQNESAVLATEKEIEAVDIEFQKASLEARLNERQIEAVNTRLLSLEEGLQKYLDERKLRDRGVVEKLKTASGRCPTCDQEIKDSLLAQKYAQNPMSLDENIAFIEEQIRAFEDVRSESQRSLNAKEAIVISLHQRLIELRILARRYREALSPRSKTPTIALIQERIQIEERLERIESVRNRSDEVLSTLDNLAAEFSKVQTELESLKVLEQTLSDGDKVATLNSLFKEQLSQYGFTSFLMSEVGIGRESYRPSRLGYDFGFTSASDMIRTVWAYHIALLEVARSNKTRHWGLLVFDEPKQQSAKDVSYAALLKRASTAGLSGQQIIFATSQDEKSLLEMIRGLEVQYVPLPQQILAPLKPLS